jgi:hypothetical protein
MQSYINKLAAVGGLTAALALAGGQAPALAGPLPFHDQYAVGGVGFCSAAGHEIYSGSIYAKPFAPVAVATAKAPNDLSSPGRKAVLYAFQPRQYLDPSLWNGNPLSADSSYSNPNVPMVGSTNLDPSLAVFLAEYPPYWDGYVEMRIFDGHIGGPYDTSAYPATIIQVRGDTWKALDEPKVSCTSGRAVSSESLLSAEQRRYYERLQAKQTVIETVSGPVSVVPPKQAPARVLVTPSPSRGKTGGAASVKQSPRVERVRPVTALYSTPARSISASRIAEIAIGAVCLIGLAASLVWTRRRRHGSGTG